MAQIKFIPDPPQQGGAFVITYDGPLPVTLQLDWDPPGAGPAEITIDGPAGLGLEAPDTATSLIAHDPTGNAPDGSTTFTP